MSPIRELVVVEAMAPIHRGRRHSKIRTGRTGTLVQCARREVKAGMQQFAAFFREPFFGTRKKLKREVFVAVVPNERGRFASQVLIEGVTIGFR